MLLRGEGEGVDVDTNGRDVGVVLVGLYFVEVAAITDLEAVMSVELQESSDDRVLTSHTLNASNGVTGLEYRAVPPVRVVERLLTLPGVDDGVIAADVAVALDNPDELLTRVVEVELDLVCSAGDGFSTSELQGLDQILVADLGELTTLISIQVDVVYIQRSGLQVGGCNAVTDGVGVAELGSDFPAEVAEVIELQVDTNLVVLESNERQSQTRVAAEPELERDVQSVGRGAVADLVGRVGLTSGAVIVAALTALNEQVGELRDVTDHLGVTGLLTRLLGELVPDVEPVAIMLVNALTTDFDFNTLDQVVANPVEPTELCARAICSGQADRRQSGLQVHTVDQITVTLDGASDTLSEARRAVEGIFNGLHSEVSVSAIDDLKKGDLGITSKVNVLGTISHELHQATTGHFCLYLFSRN